MARHEHNGCAFEATAVEELCPSARDGVPADRRPVELPRLLLGDQQQRQLERLDDADVPELRCG